jgi:prophage tail gpP-like protein
VTLKVAGTVYPGWLQCDVQRDLETIAGTATVRVDLVPGVAPTILRQQLAEVRIGQTLVLTGYVLAAEPFYGESDIGLEVVVRDRTGDLVHCSALHQGGQWRGAKLDRICADLCAPFGVDVVVAPGVDIGAGLGDFRLWHGETVLDAMSRAARLRGVLVSRDALGRVQLTKAGQVRFAGVIARGQNVISMRGMGTDEGRHSRYVAYGQGAVGSGSIDSARDRQAVAVDDEMQRYLPLVVPADGNRTPSELQALVDHTARVRRGRSMGLRYVVEGWTWQGKAWPINERVTVYDDIAGLDGQEWLITRTRQTCDLRKGDITELVVRPIEAYDTVPLNSKPKRRSFKGRGVDRAKGG